MKQFYLSLFLIFVSLSTMASGRSIRISGTQGKVSSVLIVKANNKPVVAYAAKELQSMLEQAMGCKPAIVEKPSPRVFSIILGDGNAAREAGLNVADLPDEGFFIRRQGNKLFIAGRDDDTRTPANPGFNVFYPRGTLTGIYDFLERFAGAGFFFPGPFGTVIPARGGLFLPENIDITDAPDMFFRRFSLSGRPEEHYYGNYDVQSLRRQLLPRLRESEKRYPFTHALNQLQLIRRFGKSHPEYFALMPNGKRDNDPKQKLPGHLCFSSEVREEIIQDAIAYYSGKDAKTRGLKQWSPRGVSGDMFGIMPQDGMYWCHCDKCKKIWDGEIMDAKARKAISDFMFRFFTEISERLDKEGLKHRLATMAYVPYDIVPDFPLPKTLLVQVAVQGRGGESPEDKADTAKLKAWSERTGGKVSAWFYAMGKHGPKVIPGVPAMMPRHAANFLKTNEPYLAGAYFESQTDQFIFNYLNYYVVMRLMWDNSLDAEKLMADHFRLMFGKGAPFMAKFYADLETNWTEKILGNTVETPLGPVAKVPSTREIWENIYSPAKLKQYNALFKKALAAAQGDDGAVARLEFIRREMLGPIEKAAQQYQSLQRGMDFWVARVPGSIWLRPFNGDVTEVNTKVTLRRDADSLIVRAECEEPRMKEIAARCLRRDDLEVARDSAFEILLNPSGDRKNYYQFVVNANGALADSRWQVNGKPDFRWDSGASARAGKEADSWWVEVTIPLRSLGKMVPEGFPANFARNRALATETLKNPYSMWSLFAGTRSGGFHAIDSWGKLSFEPASASLVPNGDFEHLNKKNDRPEGWSWNRNFGNMVVLDRRCFITGGRSIRIDADGSKNVVVGCDLPKIRPNRKYRLSFFLKTEGLTGKVGAGAWIDFSRKRGGSKPFPKVRITRDNPWQRLSFEFTAPEHTGDGGFVPSLGLWVWKAKGKAWFDVVRLEELPQETDTGSRR